MPFQPKGAAKGPVPASGTRPVSEPARAKKRPPTASLLGKELCARVSFVREVGGSPSSEVWEAYDRQTREWVAVKLVPCDATRSAIRLDREVHILQGLQHPGIPCYLGHGATETGWHYLITRWIEGMDLRTRLQQGALSIDEATALLRRVSSTLSAAHAAGIVHRDLSPANLMLAGGEARSARVLDFGMATMKAAARPTRQGALVGTPYYMAPEQIRGTLDADPRSDIFSLGSILYEALTGEVPFGGTRTYAVLSKIIFEPPRPLWQLRPEAPTWLTDVIDRMMRKRIEERPQSCIDILRMLDGR